ncbi:unnamed protein product, partial [Polarella glacialis]
RILCDIEVSNGAVVDNRFAAAAVPSSASDYLSARNNNTNNNSNSNNNNNNNTNTNTNANNNSGGKAATTPTPTPKTTPTPTPNKSNTNNNTNNKQQQQQQTETATPTRATPTTVTAAPVPALTAIAAAFEGAEESRSLEQARVAGRIRAQLHHGGRAGQVKTGAQRGAAPTSGLRVRLGRIPASERQGQQSDSHKEGLLVTEEAMLGAVQALCQRPGSPLPAAFVSQVLASAEDALWQRRHVAVAHLDLPRRSGPFDTKPPRAVVVGDTHGQLQDVLWIFHKHGLPSSSQLYIFNGDVADRGQNALEIYTLVLGFMVACPGSVHLNRGNHEDEMMNHGPVGGFYSECLGKYGREEGGQLYNTMRRIFALLPLAAVLDRSVFVVHAGLSRCSQLMRLLMSLHDRPSSLPTDPRNAQEQAMVDVLWSDPSETPGLTPSSRGGTLVHFGPDITARFLQENGLALVVRSHEVPPNNDGVYAMHDNRLVTVFSASNYCGTTGNQGAVLLFHEARGKLGFDVARHFAPELNSGEFIALSRDAETRFGALQQQDTTAAQQLLQSPRQEQQQQRAAELAAVQRVVQKDPEQRLLQGDLLRQVAQLVVEHKSALWSFLFSHDASKSGFVDIRIWRDGCSAVLGDLPWQHLQQLLGVEVPGSGLVDYIAFLQRFRVGLVGDEVSDAWAEELIARVFRRLLCSDWPLHDLLQHFDRDGNGTVTVPELREAFVELDAGLTGTQAASLMRTISAHASDSSARQQAGGIDIASFLSLFDMAYRPLAAAPDLPIPGWVTASLRALGHVIWSVSPNNDAVGNVEDHAVAFFQSADLDGDGLLSPTELALALQQAAAAAGLDLGLSEKEMLELARWVDTSREGQINYLEFIAGFMPEGLLSGGSFHADLMESICTTIWSNKPALLRACLCFDPDHTGKIGRDELAAALHALSSAADESVGQLLTDEQIEVLLDHTRFNAKTGQVRYRRFLDSFQVFDTAPTS